MSILILDDAGGATEQVVNGGDGDRDGGAALAAVPALRAPLVRIQGEASEHVEEVLRGLEPA